MDRNNLLMIQEGLKKEKASLATAADKMRASLTEVEQDLRRVEAAIAALDGADIKAPVKRKSAKEQAKNSLPAVGKAEVIRYIELLLRTDDVLPENNLKTRVEDLAHQHGFTRLGISLRIKEALADSRFVNSPDGVRLASTHLAS